MNPYYPNLFAPLFIKGTVFRNRIFSAPNMMCYLDADGYPTEPFIEYYANKARGGAAVVTVGDTPVDHEHAASMKRPLNLCYGSLPFFSEIAMAIHEHGAIASLELNHGGLMGLPEANGGREPMGPVDMIRPNDGVPVRAMTEEDMHTVAEHFADCAELLKIAGFDMCLVHGGHGWLLDQFLSPYFNTRTDEYGGSLENRAKFPLMVLDRIRARVGENFLIEYRMSGSEELTGGLEIGESIAFARMLQGKVDLLHVSAGLDTRPAQAVRTHPTIFLPHGVNTHYARTMKEAGITIPIVTVGAITDPAMAEELISSGGADAVAMARALIADPMLPRKAMMGKTEDIMPCMRCLDCLTGMQTGQHFQCAVNSAAGRESRYQQERIRVHAPKKVLVVGGGPGGMKAAITASEMGHDVTLAEETDGLGGLLKFTDRDELKVDLRALKEHLVYKTGSSGARVLLNTRVDRDWVEQGGYDAVILATGSVPARPPIPGLDGPLVCHATEIFEDLPQTGAHVVILGGGLVGCETGLFLARQGCTVDIIEMQPQIAPEANWMHREGMLAAFSQENITVHLSYQATEIQKNGVQTQNASGEAVVFPADRVVFAMGMRSQKTLADELQASSVHFRCIGDCIRPRKVRQAMHEGLWAVLEL